MQYAANVATVAAAIVTTASVIFSVYQFKETQSLSRVAIQLQIDSLRNEQEMKAVELFLKFNEVQQELASKPVPRKGDAAFWRHNALLTTTETVFRLTSGDPVWGETVLWMLEVQEPFLGQTEFRCKSFAPKFLTLMKQAVPSLKCD